MCRVSINTVGSTSVALPLVRYKVRQVGFQDHAGGGGVAPIMHLAAPVNTIHSVPRPKKPTVAPIALVHQGVAPSTTTDHRIEVPGGSLAGVVQGDN